MNSREVLCEFQVPLTYGKKRPDKSGQSVEPEVMLQIQEVLNRQFHGFTPLAKIEGGSWLDEETGLFEIEDSVLFRVWVTEDRIPVLEQVVAAIGKELGQKQMALVVFESNVRRINIEDSGT